MKRTYYIVARIDCYGGIEWDAYGRGILSTLNIFNGFNIFRHANSSISADTCEQRLRKILANKDASSKIVRILHI